MKKLFSKIVVICLIVSLSIMMYSSSELNIKKLTLDNGLEVMMIKRAKVPIVTELLAFKAGSFYEDESNNGLSHLFEHMYFKGNNIVKDTFEYNKKMGELGVITNAYTSYEKVVFHTTFPKENLSTVTNLMYNSIANAKFDKEELSIESKVVLNEFDYIYNNPSSHLRKLMVDEYFGKYAYKVNVLGDRDVVANATPSQMRYLRDNYFVPNRAILVIVGDIDFEKTEQIVRNNYSDWKKGRRTINEDFEYPKLEESKDVYYGIESFSKDFVKVNALASGISLDKNMDIDNFAADILFAYLSSKKSPIWKRLNPKKVGDLSIGLGWQTHSGEYHISFVAIPSYVNEAVKIIREELSKLDDEGYFVKRNLMRFKKNYIEMSEYDFSNSKNFEIADAYGSYWTNDWLSFITEGKDKEMYEKVEFEDVMKFAQDFNGTKFVWGVLSHKDNLDKYEIDVIPDPKIESDEEEKQD